MQRNDAILVGLLVVLAVMAIYWKWKQDGGQAAGFRSGFVTDAGACTTGGVTRPVDVHVQYPGGHHNPYTVLNKQIGLLRGARHDAYGQPPLWEQPHGLDRYHRSGASIKPEMIAAAERDAWFTADSPEAGDVTEGFDPNNTGMAAPTAVSALPAPNAGSDYGGYIADLIIDPRTRENHSQWVSEMGPWSGGPLIVDNMDEALEADIHFVGLRRPQAVAVYNPTQQTELGPMNLISNPRFDFRG